MRKIKFLLLSLTVLAATNSFAQDDKKEDGPAISIGAEIGIPMSTDFKAGSSFGIGGSAKGSVPVFENGAVTLSAGYMTFSGKSISIQTVTGIDPVTFQPIYGTITQKVPSSNIIPVKLGLRFGFGDGGFYGEPQLGMSFLSGGGGSAFTYAANLGYMINKMVDISARYEAFSKNSATSSFVGARLAYNFSL